MSDSLIMASSMIFALLVLLLTLFGLTRHLGAKSDNIRKNEPYESGIRNTLGDADGAFHVKFFLVGIVFLIFDIEILFLFPWALSLRELGFFGIVEMFVFLGLLIGGLIHVYKTRILQWN